MRKQGINPAPTVTLYQFNALPNERQLAHVFDEGTFLANRWEEEDGVNLYYLPGPGKGFFVEVFYAPEANAIARVRAFSSVEPLEDYAASIRLPKVL